MKRKYLMCNLEYSVKLKELGVKQNSLFYIDEYSKIYNEKEAELIFDENKYYKDIREPIKLYSAFMSDELFKILPSQIFHTHYRYKYTLDIEIDPLNPIEYYVGYLNGTKLRANRFNDKKLSNSLAQQLIWCIENGYIKLANITKSQTR